MANQKISQLTEKTTLDWGEEIPFAENGENGKFTTQNLKEQILDEVEGGITKIFTLSDTSDLVNAQAAYDWYVGGGNPIVKISGDNGLFILQSASSGSMFFSIISLNSSGDIFIRTIIFTISNGEVVAVNKYTRNILITTSLPATPDANSVYLVTN